MKRKRNLKKTVAVFAAIMIMLVSATTASAGTVNVRVNINQDAVTNLAASFGVPENQLQIISPVEALINALNVNVTLLDDGGQVDLDLNGRDALSVGLPVRSERCMLPSISSRKKTGTSVNCSSWIKRTRC